jgi:hypothetical protein
MNNNFNTFLNKSVDNLRELQVLERHKYNEAFISDGFRPDYDVLIKRRHIITKYEVKTQKIYDPVNDKFVIEIAEFSVNTGNKRHINLNDRYKKWFKTALLLSQADKYVLIKSPILLKQIAIGKDYKYYEIDKWKISQPIENFLQNINSTITNTQLEFNDQTFVDKLEELALQAEQKYNNFTDYGASDRIAINNGALESWNVSRSDFKRGNGKYNIVFNFSMDKLQWSSSFKGNIQYQYTVSPYQSQNFQGLIQTGNLKDYHFVSPDINGSGKNGNSSSSSSSNGDSSGSSSESEEERKDLRTFYNKLKNKINLQKK